MSTYTERAGLKVDTELCRFIENEVADNIVVDLEQFWSGYAHLVEDLGPENKRLLGVRNRMQEQIDDWFRQRRGRSYEAADHKAFLCAIGYIVKDEAPLAIETENVDSEIGSIAGPQLVVPVMNARFALNAANARWGSLYDAFYGTDALPQSGDLAPGNGYNRIRGAEVISRSKAFLNRALPLAGAAHADVLEYKINGGALEMHTVCGSVALCDPSAYLGHAYRGGALVLLLRHNGLHIELVVDRSRPAGQQNPAGLADVILESALTTIQDCEDSVAAVDAQDKIAVYRNWLGLMRGDLEERFLKGDREVVRSLAPDRIYQAAQGGEIVVPGRSLMLVRNVGHLMTTDAVLDPDGNETPEGFLDAMITVMAAMHDLQKKAGPRNSRSGSVYVVKPKMHGPDEVALADRLFSLVEEALGLAQYTVKIGVMDEERRTSVNLRACMRAVRKRLAFINTGFLDRTGDEIHTSMHAGPMVTKGSMRATRWLHAYEDNNVDQGIAAGLPGKGQIGKGMWAKPDAMAEMMVAKVAHPQSGASTAWVPSPTAATLHAMHYHLVDVTRMREAVSHRDPATIEEILTVPLLGGQNLSSEIVSRELENNAQSILGYVVRWVGQGIGCSKVPDIDNISLMEDRATLRISSQHIANWLLHGLIDETQVRAAFKKMASIVDRQNATDPNYQPMADALDQNIAFQAAMELVLDGVHQPSGYTEPVLHRRRREAKARASEAAIQTPS